MHVDVRYVRVFCTHRAMGRSFNVYFLSLTDVLGSLAYHEYVMSVSENGEIRLAEYRGLGTFSAIKAKG